MLSLSLDGNTQGYGCKKMSYNNSGFNDARLQRTSAENDPVRIDCIETVMFETCVSISVTADKHH